MADRQKPIQGIITTNRRAIGFVVPSDPVPGLKEDECIRVEGHHLNTALNGDTVEVQLLSRPEGEEPLGEVTRIVRRAREQFVGVIGRENGLCFLVPDDRRMYTDILIPRPTPDAKEGIKALVKITKWDNPEKDPRGEIVRVLGKKGEHEVEIAGILLEHGIDTHFPEGVAREARDIESDWNTNSERYIQKAVASGERRDFRDTLTFTIDPADAKDFDDALSLREIPNDKNQITNKLHSSNSKSQKTNKLKNQQTNKLYEVGIHIADVSHYVRPGSKLDEEAQSRGFSTYLVDRTIPMLPPELSSDICSLKPDVPRLTFSAVFTMDANARITKRWFGRGVIHSDKRFTYEDAAALIGDTDPVRARGRQGQPASNGTRFAKELNVLNQLAKKLRAERFKGGAIDFDQDEIEIEIDKRGKPTRIYRKERLDTHKLIEEFMLLANREAATGPAKKSGTFVYRVHDTPDPEKLGALETLVRGLGYRFGRPGENVSSRDLNALFKTLEGEPLENLIKTVAIRSMAKAVYATKNIGHFGLGFESYTHFTSPIRRYPDLIVHRILEHALAGKRISAEEERTYRLLLASLSQRELSIQESERESIKYKQVEYMQERIGKSFEGVITGVTEWGLYVEDKATGSEGLVKVRDLGDDFYVLDEKHYRLVGRRTKKKYSLGDTVKFKVVSANIDRRILDYVLV